MRSELSSQISSALSFMIQVDGVQEEISAWSENGECYYVFFPSHAGLNDATLHLNTTTKMFLNGQLLTDDFDLSGFEFETPYELRYSFYGTAQTSQLMFLQSANVSTMYIHTETGSMNKIHLDKDYKENAEIILVDAEGNVSYAGIGNDKIKGRGNATWHYDKKPYILQLHEASGMLGMDASEKWILLPNSSDVSNIRNKLVYDFAEKTDLYWTPDCEYVDLYLNGEYAGLYLLTEKIEISESRLDLSENTYLFALETGVLGNDFGDNFFTEASQRIEISNPVDLTDREIDDFHAYIQSVENSILSGSSDLFEYIDLDSWVRKYLIEEIFINVDAGINSQYFYRDERLSVKMFAGPIWDYDYSLGNHHHLAIQNPACFYASEVQKTPDWSTPWYAALYHNDVFYQRLVEIYQSEYLLLLNDLVNAEHLKTRMKALLQQDPYVGEGGVYNICSLYFDDYDNSCYYENENGTDPREKFRIRIYNHSTLWIMLECKHKEHGKTRKTSCRLTEEQTRTLMEGKPLPNLANQPPVLQKLTLKMMLNHMRPVIIVEYERFPFVYHSGNVRITLDTNISSASKTTGFFDPQLPKRPILPIGQQLLEVKYDEYLPDQIYRSLQLENLRQTAFSKYYLCRKYSF